MAAIEDEHVYALQIRESANDGSDFTNPDADYRRLFLGEDGLLHLRDSAGTVTTPGGGAVGTDVIWNAKGDLAVGTGSDTAIRRAVGSNGQVLTADSGETDGVKWATPSGGGTVPTILLNYTESGNISVTGMSASTWTDVLANQNFTVASATSLIEIAVRGFAIPNVGTVGELGTRMIIDSAGTPVTEPIGGDYFNTNQGNYFAGSGSVFLSGLTAAVHTIKLQAFSTAASNQFLCRTASTPPEFLRIQIIEHL